MLSKANTITKKLPNPNGTYGLSSVVFPVTVKTGDGKEKQALFTKHEMQRAVKRGAKYFSEVAG